MPAALQAHLRYPPDIFSIQSAIYGRYHLTNPGAFYAASNAWQLSPTAGAGPKSQALLAENTYNSQGQLVSTTPARMAPQYQVYALPGHEPAGVHGVGRVRAGAAGSLTNNNQNFNLTAWMVGQSDPGHYGDLDVYETPQGTYGPANADAEISANTTVSTDISLLDQNGSEVLLGETLMVPIGNSMVYLRPMYVSPATNPQPQLKYVVAVLGKNVQVDTSLSAVLTDMLGTGGARCPRPGVRQQPGLARAARCRPQVAAYLAQAQTDYQNALAALKAQNLAGYQSDIEAMSQALTAAQDLLEPASGSGTTTTTTTTPTRRRPSRRRSRPARRRPRRRHGTTTSSTAPAGTGGHDGDVDQPRRRRSTSRSAGARRRRRSLWSRRVRPAGG